MHLHEIANYVDHWEKVAVENDVAELETIRNVARTARLLLNANALEQLCRTSNGHVAAMSFAMAAGATRLMQALIECPDDALVRIMAEPFRRAGK